MNGACGFIWRSWQAVVQEREASRLAMLPGRIFDTFNFSRWKSGGRARTMGPLSPRDSEISFNKYLLSTYICRVGCCEEKVLFSWSQHSSGTRESRERWTRTQTGRAVGCMGNLEEEWVEIQMQGVRSAGLEEGEGGSQLCGCLNQHPP